MKKLAIDIPKNSCEVIRVQATEFNKYKLYDIRVFYRDGQTGEYKPSPKGISLRRHLLPKLLDALQDLYDQEEPPCTLPTSTPDPDMPPRG